MDMPLDDSVPGHPFPGDYPEVPYDQACGELQQRVARQAVEMGQRRYDESFRRSLIAALLNRVSYDDAGVRGYLDLLGLTEEPIDCPELRDRVVRLRNPQLPAEQLDDAVQILRLRGVPASVNHVAPLGPIGKGIGGAIPAPGPGAFHGYGFGEGGTAVRIGVIDDGIDAAKRSDGWLVDVPRDPDPASGNVDPLDMMPGPPDGYLDFDAGHGTFVSGVIQQVVPAAEIRMYRALREGDGVGTEVQVACAMIQAVQDGCQILNLSLGAQNRNDLPSIPIAAALDVIEQMEAERGEKVVIVAAAGNFGDTTPCWPAAFRKVVSVAALNPDLRPAAWSTRGFWVTCSAVGPGVRPTSVEGRESSHMTPSTDRFPADAWAAWSGTSFAAPQVAGAVARLTQELAIPPRKALARLLSAGRPVPDFGQALRILPGL